MLDKYLGTLFGCAIGDAIGSVSEYMNPYEIKQKFKRLRGMTGGGWLMLRPGEYTDETESMLWVAQSIIEKHGFYPEHIAGSLLKWYKSHPKDMDESSSIALGYMLDGAKWNEAGRLSWQLTGSKLAEAGSITRQIPLVLAFKDDKNLFDMIRQLSIITHYDNRVIETNIIFARILIAMLKDEELDKRLVVKGMSKALIDDFVSPIKIDPENTKINDALSILKIALTILKKHKGFEDAIVKAVNLGGYSGTIGALIGALSGARYGMDSIPVEWLSIIDNFDEIYATAESLHEIAGERYA